MWEAAEFNEVPKGALARVAHDREGGLNGDERVIFADDG